MKVYIVNGPPGCGKTTFEKMAKAIMIFYGYMGMIYSSIDFVKEIAQECGWDGSKTPKNRKFLSDLKELLTEWDDVPFKKIEERLEQFEIGLSQYEMSPAQGVAFIDIREPEEIKKACERLGAKSILITRGDVDAAAFNSNKSDNSVYDYEYDIVIQNDGTLEDLQQKAKHFVEKDLAI